MQKSFTLLIFLLFAKHSLCQIVFDKKFNLGLATGGLRVIEVPDGYVTVGGSIPGSSCCNRNFIVKIDLNGDSVKTLNIPSPDSVYYNTYGHDPDGLFRELIKTADSNLMAVGRTQAYNPINEYDHDILLVKLNYNLDTLWVKTYSHASDTSLIPHGMIQTNDGGFLIGGHQFAFISSIFYDFLYKVDSAGNFQWYKSYSSPGPEQEISCVIETPAYEFICSGTQIINWFNDIYAPMVFKTDSVGNINYVYNLFSMYGYGRDIIYSNDGKFVMNYNNYPFPSPVTKLIKFDYPGNVMFDKSYGNGSIGGFSSHSIQAQNGGFLICGSVKLQLNNTNAYIIKVDENGDSLWLRQYDLAIFDEFRDVKATSDGGYVMCGQNACCNPGGTSLWIVKTDSLGLLTGIAENEAVKSAKLGAPYPNPCRESCRLTAIVPQTMPQGFGRKGAFLLLFDMHGRQLMEKNLSTGVNHILLDMKTYPAGTYLAVLAVDGYNAGAVSVVKQ